jgi:hypothetical protein
MWLFKEDCSHAALEFDTTTIYHSHLSGIKHSYFSDFITKNKIIHTIELKLTPEQNASLHAIYNYEGHKKWSAENLFILLDLWMKGERPDYLCTPVFKSLPDWLVCIGTKQRNFGLITAFRLYKLILEHIRSDTVKILKTF